MHSILIVGPSWVGDTVLAQPLFMRLHQRHPQLALDVLAPPWTAPVLRRMAEVRAVIDNPFRHGELRLTDRYRLGRALAKGRYARAIVLPNSLKSALVPMFAGIPVRTGFTGELRRGFLTDARRLDERALPLMVERFAALAERRGVPLARPVPEPRLTVTAAQRAATLAALGLAPRGPVVAFCPGAEYGPAKRWPEAHFAELAGSLAARGFEVWLLGSPKDRPVGEAIERLAGPGCRNLCGGTTLDQAVDLLSAAAHAVTNDSGLMHVAAALGVPLTALYGSSSPEFTPPLSASARVLKIDLECSPCFRRECPLGHFRCMMELTPSTVLSKMETVLTDNPLKPDR